MTLLLPTLLACYGKPSFTVPAGDPARPDVILLSVDTLRPDHLGAYGYTRDTSPFLDGMASQGARFASAWAPSPWTLPSHATMLTGQLPDRHGAIEDHLSVSTTSPWLPEAFQAAGYATGGVVATLYVSRRYGFQRGFDAFDDFDIQNERQNLRETPDAPDVFARALAWGASLPPGKPVFLFLHVYDVHYPYDAPSPFSAKFDRPPRKGDPNYKNYDYFLENPLTPEQLEHQIAQYDEEIAFVDASFRDFLAKWTAQRQAIIAVTADHGEELGERGSWGHGHTLWPEQLRVPLILSGPGVVAGVHDKRVGTEDIAPTLASLAGVPFPGADGTDRAHLVRGTPASAPSPVAARLADTSRFDTLRYRWHLAPYDYHLDLRSGERFLCDLSKDAACVDDASARAPEAADAAESAFWTHFGAPWGAPEAQMIRTDGVLRLGDALHTGRVPVPAGARFAILPLDARVAVEKQGPWQAAAGRLPPPGALLTYDGQGAGAGEVRLDDAERKALEALGYVQ